VDTTSSLHAQDRMTRDGRYSTTLYRNVCLVNLATTSHFCL